LSKPTRIFFLFLENKPQLTHPPFLLSALLLQSSVFLHCIEMPASLLNQTLPIAATKNLMASSTPLLASANPQEQWNAATVYGLVFGLLAVMLGFPGAILAITALKRRREHSTEQSELEYTIRKM
jgi:hypothetical protein